MRNVLVLIAVTIVASVSLPASRAQSFEAQIQQQIRESQLEIQRLQRNIALNKPAILEKEIPILEKTDFLGSDFRKVNGVIENSWDLGFWVTVFGKVERGDSLGARVVGYKIALTGVTEGTFLIRTITFDNDLQQGQNILVRAKETGEVRKKEIAGEMEVLEFGYPADPPKGKGASNRDWKTVKHKEAVDRLKELRDRSTVARDRIVHQEEQQRDQAAEKARRQQEIASAKQAEADEKQFKSEQDRAVRGSATAQYALGMRYLLGRGVTSDAATGRDLLAKAGEQGNPEAQAALLIFDNQGDLNDRKLWTEAVSAHAGVSSAQFSVGMRLLNGDGLQQNKSLAKSWLQKAADKENAAAKAVLEKGI